MSGECSLGTSLLQCSHPRLEKIPCHVQDNTLLNQIRRAMPDTEILDIGVIQCTPGCDVVEGDQLLYIDERHFTKLGAKPVGDQVRVSLELLGIINSEPRYKR
jgi:hypothetical protein